MNITLRSIYSAIPAHHTAAVHGKIAGALLATKAIQDAVPLIHGPVGCSFQRKINPYSLSSPVYDTPCTDLKNIDVVYGAEEKLGKGIIETNERYSPRMIVVITTCTSDLMGDDIQGVIEKVKPGIDCEVVYSTGDFVGGSRSVGIQDTLYAITDQFLSHQNVEKNHGSVNLLLSPAQQFPEKYQEMASLLTQMGIKINKVCFQNTKTQDLCDLAKADLNIIGYRMPWVELMKKKMGLDYCTITGWERYNRERDPTMVSPYGISGSYRIYMEIAKIMNCEGEAEGVLNKSRDSAEIFLQPLKERLKNVKIAAPVGFSLSLLKDTGVDLAVLLYRTQLRTKSVSEKAIQEIERANLNLAEIFGYHPDLLINPTPEEEVQIYKKRDIDLVIAPSKIAHFYNHAGFRTVDLGDFSQRKLNVGFEPSIELCKEFLMALHSVRKRDPLLCLMDFDKGISNLSPHWADIAMNFHHIRSQRFRQGSYQHFHGLAGVELDEHDI